MSIIETVLKALEGFNRQRSNAQRARAYAECDLVISTCKRIQEGYKEPLMKARVYELFPEYALKVEYMPPKSSSYIDAEKLAKKLIRDGRMKDLFSIISITETALKALDDGEALAEKYRCSGEDSKESIRVAKMTKDEIQQSPVKE